MDKLKERLQDPKGFSSYKAIWQWVREQGVEVAYTTVHRIVRSELKAQLKVPRPRHHKQHPQAIETFKKNRMRLIGLKISFLFVSLHTVLNSIRLSDCGSTLNHRLNGNVSRIWKHYVNEFRNC